MPSREESQGNLREDDESISQRSLGSDQQQQQHPHVNLLLPSFHRLSYNNIGDEGAGPPGSQEALKVNTSVTEIW